jgi:hypothetical protein
MNTNNSLSISRFAILAATLLGLLCLASTTAYAGTVAATVTPESLQAHGFSMRTENQKDGTVAFTLIRDLSKAKSFPFPADSGLQVSRSATLSVAGDAGLLAQCYVARDSWNQKNTITYRFTLSRDCIAHSRLMLAEDYDHKDQTREHLIGGGTHYEFDLALFAKPSDDKAR